MRFFIACDPGIKGAIAILNEAGEIVQITDTPTVQVKVGSSTKNVISPPAIADDLSIVRGHDCVAMIEKVSTRPGEGAVGAFTFGRTLGVVEGVLAGMGIPTEMIGPSVWTKAMRVNPGKDGSRQRAMELWPKKAGMFKRVKDDGRADSVLIARYLWERSK
jgi:crossover junction endodeoxyribonuclease RuvC